MAYLVIRADKGVIANDCSFSRAWNKAMEKLSASGGDTLGSDPDHTIACVRALGQMTATDFYVMAIDKEFPFVEADGNSKYFEMILPSIGSCVMSRTPAEDGDRVELMLEKMRRKIELPCGTSAADAAVHAFNLDRAFQSGMDYENNRSKINAF